MTDFGGKFGGGAAESELRFEQEAGERGVEFALEGSRGEGASAHLIAGVPSERGTHLADDAWRASDDEVDLQYGRGAGVLVDQICGFGVSGGDGFLQEDKGVFAPAEAGQAGASIGSDLDCCIQTATERVGYGIGGGFRGDEENGTLHRNLGGLG